MLGPNGVRQLVGRPRRLLRAGGAQRGIAGLRRGIASETPPGNSGRAECIELYGKAYQYIILVGHGSGIPSSGLRKPCLCVCMCVHVGMDT